jgi:methyl-accepting chemotaxis protein
MEKIATEVLGGRPAERGILAAIRNSKWRRRKQYVVDKSIQYRITRQYVTIALIAAALGLYISQMAAWLYGIHARSAVHPAYAHWSEQVLVWSYGAVSVLLGLGIFLLISLFYSHRVAGPVVKIVAALKEIAQGNLGVHVRLRETDYLKEVASGVNELCGAWRRSLDEIEEALEPLKLHTEPVDAATLQRQIAAVQDVINGFDRPTG